MSLDKINLNNNLIPKNILKQQKIRQDLYKILEENNYKNITIKSVTDKAITLQVDNASYASELNLQRDVLKKILNYLEVRIVIQ